MKKLLVLIALVSSAWAVDTPLYRLTNALGYADRDGNFSYWWDCNDTIPLVGKRPLPIRFHFGSAPDTPAKSCLGSGWWFPLLESCLIAQDEEVVKLHTIGGGVEFLIKDRASDGRYVSEDGKWAAQVDGQRTEISAPGDWKFRYRQGLIEEMSYGRQRLRWIRRDGHVTKIEGDNGPLLEAEYNADGLLSELSLPLARSVIRMDFADVPLFAQVQGSAMITSLQKTLAAVREPGAQGMFEWSHDSDSKMRRLTTIEHVPGRQPRESSFSWEMFGNRLLSDPDGTYTFKEAADATDKRPVIYKHHQDGSQEAYHYFPSRGQMWQMDKAGIERSRFYIITPGANFGRLRKVVETGKGGSEKTVFESWFDAKGNVLRTFDSVNGCPMTRSFDSSGNLVSVKMQDDRLGVFKDGASTVVADEFGFPLFSLNARGGLEGTHTGRTGWLWNDDRSRLGIVAMPFKRRVLAPEGGETVAPLSLSLLHTLSTQIPANTNMP